MGNSQLYMKWVSEQLAPHVTMITAEVVRIDLNEDGRRWNLELREQVKNATSRFLLADSLMLTGPGKTRMSLMDHDTGVLPAGVYDLESFWTTLKSGEFSVQGRLAIVGAGENAASALMALAQHRPSLRADVISPRGFISTRAEGFYENQIYSQPDLNGWKDFELRDRIEFIGRTDLGVFSTHAMKILNEQVRHQIIAGRVVGLSVGVNAISLKLEYNGCQTIREYDQVILATGFDQVATLKSFLSARALAALQTALGTALNQWDLSMRIQSDLSVEGLTPALHLPMLAGLTQGPGFANLSCLGLLSDRIVGSPLKKISRRQLRTATPLGLVEASL